MPGLASPASADRAPVFTERQIRGIRRIARKFGYAYDQEWDFVHETWVKLAAGWLRVPRVEPSRTRYVLGIARNLAIDLFRRFEDDAMTGAIVTSSLPEYALEEAEEQPGEDRPGTPDRRRPTIPDRVLAEELLTLARLRNEEAAEWMVRNKVFEETHREIAADIDQPRERIKKSVTRLLKWLRSLDAEVEEEEDEGG